MGIAAEGMNVTLRLTDPLHLTAARLRI